MVHYNGINHLALATGDMDVTIKFWQDTLGMKIVERIDKPGFKHYFFRISDTDMIAFFEWEGVKPVHKKEHGEPVKGPFIFDHVAIGLESKDDLVTIKSRLVKDGFDASEVIDHGSITSVYSHDPNGIPIEFCVKS